MSRPWNFDADRERQKQEVKERLSRARACAPRTPLKSAVTRSSCTSETARLPDSVSPPKKTQPAEKPKSTRCSRCRGPLANSQQHEIRPGVVEPSDSGPRESKTRKSPGKPRDALTKTPTKQLQNSCKASRTYTCDAASDKSGHTKAAPVDGKRHELSERGPRKTTDPASIKAKPAQKDAQTPAKLPTLITPKNTADPGKTAENGIATKPPADPEPTSSSQGNKSRVVPPAKSDDQSAADIRPAGWSPPAHEARPRIVLDECTLSSDEPTPVTMSVRALPGLKVITVETVAPGKRTDQPKASSKPRKGRGKHLAPDVKLILMEMGLRSVSHDEPKSNKSVEVTAP